MVDPCHVGAVLVVLHKDLYVLYVLELDVAERHRVPGGKVSRGHSEHNKNKIIVATLVLKLNSLTFPNGFKIFQSLFFCII